MKTPTIARWALGSKGARFYSRRVSLVLRLRMTFPVPLQEQIWGRLENIHFPHFPAWLDCSSFPGLERLGCPRLGRQQYLKNHDRSSRLYYLAPDWKIRLATDLNFLEVKDPLLPREELQVGGQRKSA